MSGHEYYVKGKGAMEGRTLSLGRAITSSPGPGSNPSNQPRPRRYAMPTNISPRYRLLEVHHERLVGLAPLNMTGSYHLVLFDCLLAF